MTNQNEEFLIKQTGCTIEKAQEMLTKHNNNIEDALFDLLNTEASKNNKYASTNNQIDYNNKKPQTKEQLFFKNLRKECDRRDEYLENQLKHKSMGELMAENNYNKKYKKDRKNIKKTLQKLEEKNDIITNHNVNNLNNSFEEQTYTIQIKRNKHQVTVLFNPFMPKWLKPTSSFEKITPWHNDFIYYKNMNLYIKNKKIYFTKNLEFQEIDKMTFNINIPNQPDISLCDYYMECFKHKLYELFNTRNTPLTLTMS